VRKIKIKGTPCWAYNRTQGTNAILVAKNIFQIILFMNKVYGIDIHKYSVFACILCERCSLDSNRPAKGTDQ
jgi:hypothetical protein